MGKLTPFRQTVRTTEGGVTIFFKTRESIYISDGKSWYVCHRFFYHPRNSYKESWHPFCEKLVRSNSLNSVYDVIKLANLFGVSWMGGIPKQTIPNDIEVRKSVFSQRKEKT